MTKSSIYIKALSFAKRVTNDMFDALESLDPSPQETITKDISDIQQRAFKWIAHGKVGISSQTIWEVMLGIVMEGRSNRCRYSVPYDPTDFKRCYLLLQEIPEWRERLPEVALIFPEWEPLVANWSELERLYEEGSESEWSYKLYDRIKELRGEE